MIRRDNGRVMPGHIRCFIDLRKLPEVNNTRFQSTIHMIVEPGKPNMAQDERKHPSELFIPIIKAKAQSVWNQNQFTIQHKMVSIDNLVGPACVIPDLNNQDDAAFLHAKPMSSWADGFRN